MCGFVLHIYLSSEILQGFNNIKYSVNHPWKFERKLVAFFAGFSQIVVVVVIEITNFALIMTSVSYKELTLNFIILVIVSQFDDFFYQTFSDSTTKSLLRGDKEPYSDLLMVQQTTSLQAKHRVSGNRT